MPNLDKSGPMGEGPMTGRKQGRCNPKNKGLTKEEILQQEENQQNPPARGLGLGLGLRRRGRRGPGRGGAGRGRW
mgnify:CR=1 FL=1